MAHHAGPRVLAALALAWLAAPALAGDLSQRLGLHTGREIYQAACAACHGHNGDGTPTSQAGFERPDTFPHFDRCNETTPEYTRDYTAVIREGGPARGFSPIMPAFGGVLDAKQIRQVVAYLRSLCKQQGWPLGELNVPRALVTDKAFPESETVLTTTANTRGPASVSNAVDYERVIGRRDQLEVVLPFGWNRLPDGALGAGIGDTTLGLKHVLHADLNTSPDEPQYAATGSILSVQAEIVVPTGSVRKQLGTGQTSFGLFAAYDYLLPQQAFVQLQAGTDLPVHAHDDPRSLYLNSAIGRSFAGDRELGRQWTPMLELIGTRDLVAGTTTDWDVIPELQVTLNRRQHIRAALGYRTPINDTAGRPRQIIAYFLWDWFDGGLLEGW